MVNSDYLKGLNDAQNKAVTHLDGPLLIVAGAGSGKTRVLTSRIVHIIKKKKNSFCDLIRGAHDAWSGWLCVLVVGLCSGVMAGIIDIGATWLTDIKFGICPSAFYLNREQCCWSSNETVIDISGNCSLW